MNSDKLHNKIIDLAIEICQRYGEEAGNWTCTDWFENRELLDAFTKEEKLLLYKEHEDYNSNLEEYDPDDVDYMWSDEFCIAWMIRDALQNHCKIPEYFIDPDDWILQFASAVM